MIWVPAAFVLSAVVMKVTPLRTIVVDRSPPGSLEASAHGPAPGSESKSSHSVGAHPCPTPCARAADSGLLECGELLATQPTGLTLRPMPRTFEHRFRSSGDCAVSMPWKASMSESGQSRLETKCAAHGAPLDAGPSDSVDEPLATGAASWMRRAADLLSGSLVFVSVSNKHGASTEAGLQMSRSSASVSVSGTFN